MKKVVMTTAEIFVMAWAERLLISALILGTFVACVRARKQQTFRSWCSGAILGGAAMIVIGRSLAMIVIEDRRRPQDPAYNNWGNLPDGVFLAPVVMGALLVAVFAVIYAVIWIQEMSKVDTDL